MAILGDIRAEEPVEEAQPTPKAFDPERWPLDRSVDNWIALKLFELEKPERLRFQLRENLWFSIVDLDSYVNARETDKRFQDIAKKQLVATAKYFGENPKELRKPEDLKLAQRIETEVKAAQQRAETANARAMIEAELHDGFEPLFQGLDKLFSDFLTQVYARDLMTQAIVDRINAEQDGAEQPATAPESKPEGKEKPKPESEGRSQ